MRANTPNPAMMRPAILLSITKRRRLNLSRNACTSVVRIPHQIIAPVNIPAIAHNACQGPADKTFQPANIAPKKIMVSGLERVRKKTDAKSPIKPFLFRLGWRTVSKILLKKSLSPKNIRIPPPISINQRRCSSKNDARKPIPKPATNAKKLSAVAAPIPDINPDS